MRMRLRLRLRLRPILSQGSKTERPAAPPEWEGPKRRDSGCDRTRDSTGVSADRERTQRRTLGITDNDWTNCTSST